jgi:hypothetical protein
MRWGMTTWNLGDKVTIDMTPPYNDDSIYHDDGFAEECRRQSRAAAKNKRAEGEVLQWIAANHDDEGWTP